MKAIAINIVGILIIALIGLALLFLFVSGPLTDMTSSAFCYFSNYIGVSAEGCESEPTTYEKVELEVSSAEDLATHIAAYSIMCWNQARATMERNDMLCYQLLLEKSVGKVYEYDLTQALEEGGGCEKIQNSMIEDQQGNLTEYSGYCGNKDEIDWDVSRNVIENQTLIIIKYDLDVNKIVIKC